MAVGGGPTHAPVIVGTPGTALFHRVESPSQDRATAARQVASMEIWGTGAGHGSGIPAVKAYRNALPPRPGIEFSTPILSTPGTGTPYEARWYMGSPGVASRGGGAFAAISVSYIKNTQVP